MSDFLLSDAEIARMTEPLKRHSSRVEYLRTLGYTVDVAPNGKPLVARVHAEEIQRRRAGVSQTSDEPQRQRVAQPGRGAMVLLLNSRRHA